MQLQARLCSERLQLTQGLCVRVFVMATWQKKELPEQQAQLWSGLDSLGLRLHRRPLHPVQRPEGQREPWLVHRTGPRSFQCLIPTFAIRHLPSDDLRDETDPILMNKLYETSLVEALRTPTSSWRPAWWTEGRGGIAYRSGLSV